MCPDAPPAARRSRPRRRSASGTRRAPTAWRRPCPSRRGRLQDDELADARDRDGRPLQDLWRRGAGAGGRRPAGRAGRGVRLPRPERRRQEHAHPHPARPDPADRRPRRAAGPGHPGETAARRAADRLPAGRPAPRPPATGREQLASLSACAAAATSARSRRSPTAWAGELDRPMRDLSQGQPAEDRPGPGVHAPARACRAGRADQRARPARPGRRSGRWCARRRTTAAPCSSRRTRWTRCSTSPTASASSAPAGWSPSIGRDAARPRVRHVSLDLRRGRSTRRSSPPAGRAVGRGRRRHRSGCRVRGSADAVVKPAARHEVLDSSRSRPTSRRSSSSYYRGGRGA